MHQRPATESLTEPDDPRVHRQTRTTLWPLPGIQKLWSAWTIFAPAMLLYRDFKKYGTDDGSSMGN